MKTPLIARMLAIGSAVFSLVQLAHAQSSWTGGGTDQNWSTSGNWSGGVPGSGITVTFPDGVYPITTNTQGAVNSVVQSDTAIASLTYNNQSTNFNTTMIPPGTALIVSGGLSSGANDPATINTVVAFTGGGSLFAGTNGTSTWIGQNGSGQGAASSLDLSGLTSFSFNTVGAAGGAINLGTGSSGSSIQVSLAANSNNVTATTFNIANNNTRGSVTLNLGNGTNIINADTINMGFSKTTGTLQFRNNAGGGLTIVNRSGSGRANINISGQANTGATTAANNGFALFNGGTVNILANTIVIGNRTARSGNTATGVLNFNSGIVDATTINMALNLAGGGASFGSVSVGGGTLRIGTGGMSMVNQGGTAGEGALIVTNGATVICSNHIYKTTANGVGTITISDSTLSMASLVGTIGVSNGFAIDNLNITNSVLNLPIGVSANIAVMNFNPDATTQNTINASALPSITSYPAQFPIISYMTASGNLGSLALGAIPSGFSGYLSNNVTALSIDLVVTNGPAAKADLWGGGINNLWDTSTLNWTNGGVAVNYLDLDFVTFDDSAKTNIVNITGTRLPATWTNNNSVLNYTFNGVGKISGPVQLVKEGTASLTLSETGGDNFSGGIVVNAGTVVLDNAGSAISGGLTIASGATVRIGNNNANGALPSGTLSNEGTLVFNRANDFLVSVAIPGAGAVTQSGSGRLALSSVNTYTGDTTINGGTLALTNAGSIATSAQVTVNGAALDTSGVTGSTILTTLNMTNSTLTVKAGYLQTNQEVTSLNMGGAGNTINVRTLPPIAYYPATMVLLQAGNPISGYNFTLGTLPAATPSYAGSVALSGDGTAVVLTLTAGPIGTRPSVTWSGADGLINGNTNWSDALNWQTPGVPTSAESVTFNSTAAAAGSPFNAVGEGANGIVTPANVNNFLDLNLTNAALTYGNAGGFHNTHIGPGRTYGLNGSLIVNGAGGTATILGAGSALRINNPGNSSTLNVGNATAATLDMSGLDNLTATLSQIGIGYNTANPGSAFSGNWYLARTNTITTGSGFSGVNAALVIGGSSGTSQNEVGQVYLGKTNAIFADGIVLGVGRSPNNVLTFNPTVASPVAFIRGIVGSASRVTLWSLGDSTVNLNNNSPGFNQIADFSAGTLDARVSTLTVGQGSQGNTALAVDQVTATFTMGAGTLDVTALRIGVSGGGAAGNGIGIMNVTGGTVTANTLGLGLSGASGGTPATSGTLNLTNATLTVSNGINLAVGSAGGTLSISSSTVKILNGTIGTPAAPLTTLNLNGGSLQLNVDGNASDAVVVATTVNTNTPTVINIGAIANVSGAVQLPLISYTGNDPFGGLTLGTYPSGYTVSLVDNTGNSSIDLSIASSGGNRPRITGFGISGITLTLTATNGVANGQFVLLGSANVELPLNQWTPILTNLFDGSGNLNLSTNVINPAVPRQFYLLSQ